MNFKLFTYSSWPVACATSIQSLSSAICSSVGSIAPNVCIGGCKVFVAVARSICFCRERERVCVCVCVCVWCVCVCVCVCDVESSKLVDSLT